MSALSERQFGEYTLRYKPPDMEDNRHRIIAAHPKAPLTTEGPWAGELAWHPKSHEVTGVHVYETFRRQGLATEMWRMGQELRPRPKHSPDRTDAGEAWSKSVGGSRPRRLRNNMRDA